MMYWDILLCNIVYVTNQNYLGVNYEPPEMIRGKSIGSMNFVVPSGTLCSDKPRSCKTRDVLVSVNGKLQQRPYFMLIIWQ